MAFDFGLSALKDRFSNTSAGNTSTSSTNATQKKHRAKQLFGTNFYPR